MQKIKEIWYSAVAKDVRLTIYGILLVAGTYYVFFDQGSYACNLPGRACPFCGMKTAVYHFLHLRFLRAHESNPFVWILAVIGVVVVIDIALIVAQRKKKTQ